MVPAPGPPNRHRVTGTGWMVKPEERRTSPPKSAGNHLTTIFGLRSVTVMDTVWVTVVMPSVTEKVAR